MNEIGHNGQTHPVTRRSALFAISHLVVWPLGASAAWKARMVRQARIASLPPLNDVPIQVRPLQNIPAIVSDEQLLDVLSSLRLKVGTVPPKVNHVDHALRMWGHEVSFDDDRFMDGPEMLQMLAEDRALRAVWGTDVRPLLIKTAHGLRVRTQEGAATSSHVDHTLATFTEIGLPLHQQLVCRDARAELRDLVESALRSFSLNQKEYEWTALALGMYARGDFEWYSSERQQITFDRLARRVMREPLGHGVCYGGHRLFTLVLLSRIDRKGRGFFSAEVRQEIHDHLLEATRRLVSNQHPDGYWDDAWPGVKLPGSKGLWTQGARLVATGHALEWWAMTIESDLLPPRESLVRAGQWLVRELKQMEPESIQKNYTFLTHVGRALSLWRGEFPAESWSRLATSNGTRVADGQAEPSSAEPSFWNDDRGALLSIEMLLLATITILGILVGLTTYRNAIVQELGDTAAGVAALTQSYAYSGVDESGTFEAGTPAEISYSGSAEGSSFVDNVDYGEAVLDAPDEPPMCILINASSIGDEI